MHESAGVKHLRAASGPARNTDSLPMLLVALTASLSLLTLA
jgi:hypothetical protein